MRALLLFTTLAVAVRLFAEPSVQTLDPNRGTNNGGTEVTIRGKDLGRIVVCLLPCPTTVTFGETTVEALEISDEELRVTTPPHAAGTVDVTVSIPAKTPVVVENGFTFLAGPEADYERVLLPVWWKDSVPGAQGTQWRTDFWLRNDGENGVRIAAYNCPASHACLPVFPATYTLLPGYALHNVPDFSVEPRNNPSQLLYLSSDSAAGVEMSLRVADVSRGALNAGTDIPVVRESELLTDRAQLLNVPTDGRFRVLLRLYEVNGTSATFLVRLYAQTEEPSVSTLYETTMVTVTPQSGQFRTEAAYAQLPIAELHTADGLPAQVRIEVKPLTAGVRYWAFASVTNNETQLVTLVTPQ
ncbi:MAG: IPT/TIG domain-containing protein [Acidobacteriota bacterium]